MMVKNKALLKKLAKKIVYERKIKKITQDQLATLSEIDRTYIARIEKGKANPTVKILGKICKILKIKLSRLFRGT